MYELGEFGIAFLLAAGISGLFVLLVSAALDKQ